MEDDQTDGTGGGAVNIFADVITVEGNPAAPLSCLGFSSNLVSLSGTISANGGDGETPGTGGGAGGSVVLHAPEVMVSAQGVLAALGGKGACVPNCLACNEATRQCESCTNNFFWVEFNCLSDCADSNNRR